MARLHLFEFEDLPWFPAFLRDYVTDFLQYLSNKAQMYRGIVPLLKNAMDAGGTDRIVDLASGGGGGWLWLSGELRKDRPGLKIFLTDYFPNVDAFRYTAAQSPVFEFREDPVDARNVPVELKGLRTQFLSLHHFRPADARRILQNAVESGQPIAIFEGQERSVPGIVMTALSPISVLLATPFIRPFKMGRIVFTYLIPVVPLVTMWDGVVSCLRTYSVDEMKDLVAGLDNKEAFDWEIGRQRFGPGWIPYLIGTPRK